MTVNIPMKDYGWNNVTPHTEVYLHRPLKQLLLRFARSNRDETVTPLKVLDLGCGNGSLAQELHRWGHKPVGVDPSPSGIAEARLRAPELSFHQASATPEQLAALQLPPFDVVVSTEVVEHCYSPLQWAAAAHASLRPGGLLICSTPYHGYLKNCALALSGRLDAHFTALWEGGHIKFWSRRTLGILLTQAGFGEIQFCGAGRVPFLWRSMILSALKLQ